MDFDTAKTKMEEKQRIEALAKLTEPFDVEEIYWKPQATNKAKDQAIAAAYADPRAYSDRLNEVLGTEGWSEHYEVSVINPMPPNPAKLPKEKEWRHDLTYEGKVLIICTLTIHGIGTHSGTGEEEATNDNAITSAEAQAFKRAATRFGLGRYLYDLPKGQWCAYDSTSKKFVTNPPLPDWAIPKKICEKCYKVITEFKHGDRTISATELIANSRRKYAKQLCALCQQELAKVPGPPTPPAPKPLKT